MKLLTLALYLTARREVEAALAKGVEDSGPVGPDALHPEQCPSVRIDGLSDRVLGEFDQDGFVAATDPRDQGLFPARTLGRPRTSHRLQIVLTDGTVRIRKAPIIWRGR